MVSWRQLRTETEASIHWTFGVGDVAVGLCQFHLHLSMPCNRSGVGDVDGVLGCIVSSHQVVLGSRCVFSSVCPFGDVGEEREDDIRGPHSAMFFLGCFSGYKQGVPKTLLV